MSVSLYEAISAVVRKHVEGSTFIAEFGVVKTDKVTGKDLTIKLDTMNVALSWNAGHVQVPDDLILLANDRVLVTPANNGNDYCVLFRLSKDPTKARHD